MANTLRKPSLKGSDLVRELTNREKFDALPSAHQDDLLADLRYYLEEYPEAIKKALHQALVQPEDYDPIPSYRRVKPSIVGTDIADWPLFCMNLAHEGDREVLRPGKRIKELLDPAVWEMVQRAASSEWEKSLEILSRVAQQVSSLEEVYVLGPADRLPLAIWRKIRDSVQISLADWSALEAIAQTGLETIYGDPRAECRVLNRAKEVGNQWKETISQALSSLLACPTFYEQEHFKAVSIPEEARELLRRDRDELSIPDVKRLNRLLMEAAFPRFLGQSRERQPSYWSFPEKVVFALVEYDAQWLADPVIQCQIKNWQKTLKATRSAASRQSLKHIGECLVPIKARGAGNFGVPAEDIRKFYREIYKWLKNLGQRWQSLPPDKRNFETLLSELLEDPEWKRVFCGEPDEEVERELTSQGKKEALEWLERWTPRRLPAQPPNPPKHIPPGALKLFLQVDRRSVSALARQFVAEKTGHPEDTVRDKVNRRSKTKSRRGKSP